MQREDPAPVRTVLRTRRRFLSGLAGTALLAPLAKRLSAVESVVAGDLQTLAEEPWWSYPEGLRDRYMLDPSVVYLNHASIGTMPSTVHTARSQYSAICESNPHLYIWGGAWDELLTEVRGKAARFMGVAATEVAITHNTTEGFNTLAHGLPLGRGDEVLFSSLNHGGASIPWRHASEARGFSVRRFDFPMSEIPGMSAEDVVEAHRRELREETKVLVIPHLDNIVGLRHPLAELNAMAKSNGVEFVAVDGAQAVGMIPVEAGASGVDAYSTSPHKWLQTPKGLGLFFLRAEWHGTVRPMWVRYGVRRWEGTPRVYEDYGTRNSPEVMALGDAMDFQDALGADEKTARLVGLWTGIRERVTSAAHLTWNSPRSWDGGGSLVSVGFAGTPAASLSRRISRENGIVLRPFETDELNAFRISPNVMTTDDELDAVFRILDSLA